MKRPERKEREAAALRANLLKRKEQMRRRDAEGSEEPAEDVPDPPKDDTKHEE